MKTNDNVQTINLAFNHFTSGHGAGDLLLMEVASRLKSCVREKDSVARFGGDEFVVMLGDLDKDKNVSISHTEFVAEKIRAAVSEPYRLTVGHDDQTEARFCSNGFPRATHQPR